MKVLMVGDPNLGERGKELVGSIFPGTELVIFQKSVPGSKEAALKRIVECDEQVLISFYNDLYIPPQALDRAAANVNLHPALPHVGGVGYDTVPILEAHPTYGSTAHIMDAQFDHGSIYKVIERPRRNWCYRQQRRANQAACLRLLKEVVSDLKHAGSPSSFRDLMLEQAQRLTYSWGNYYNGSTVSQLLRATYERNPRHPVFVGNEKFFSMHQTATVLR